LFKALGPSAQRNADDQVILSIAIDGRSEVRHTAGSAGDS
jgi:hypothetical protein